MGESDEILIKDIYGLYLTRNFAACVRTSTDQSFTISQIWINASSIRGSSISDLS